MKVIIFSCVLMILLSAGCVSNPAKEDRKYCALFVSYSVKTDVSVTYYNQFLRGYRCNPSLTEIRELECKLRSGNSIPEEATVFVWFWNIVSYDIDVK